MIGTAPPRHEPDRARIAITPDEFERRLAAHGHRPAEIHRLWNELSEPEAPLTTAPGAGLGLGPLIAVYLGLLLLVAASVSLLAIYWQELGAAGILALGLVFLAGSLVASESLRRRLAPQPADVLEAVAVGWLALVAYAVERLAGVWPPGGGDVDHVHVGLTIIAAVGLGAGLGLLTLRPDPLLLVPLAAATGLLAVDLAELLFGNDLSPRGRAASVLPVGLAWIGGGLWLDVTRRRPFATWAHWVGLLTAGGAVLVLVPKTVPGFAVIGVLGAAALFFSAFVRHWAFTVLGAVGVLTATTSAVGMLGGIAPLVVALVGLALIGVGLRWSRWRETIRTATLARLPESVRSLAARLAP